MAGLEQDRAEENRKGVLLWLKRLGWAGFLFFTIKGLIWLAVFFGLGTFLSNLFG